MKKYNFFILATFCLIGWFVLTYRIEDVPPGINGDEAAIGLNVIHVAKDGKDLNGKFLPIFTSLPDSSDWKQPITFYSEVLAFKIFSPSYFTLRAVSVLFALLSGLLIYLLLRNLLGVSAAIFGFLLFLTTPIIVIQSHLALENIAPVPFITLWLISIIKYNQNPKIRYLLIMVLALILSFYSYLGMRLIMPVLFCLSLALIFYKNKAKKLRFSLNHIFLFTLLFIPFLLSLLFLKNEYPGSLWGLYRPYIVESYQDFFLTYLSNFDPSFLYIKGDQTPYHSTGKHGMFLLATLPLFILGIIKIVRINKGISNFILISFFLAPILFGLGSTIHRASRLVGLVPIYVVICCFGIVYILNFKRKVFKIMVISGVIILILMNYLDFMKDYWFEYPKRVQSDFARPIHLGFEKLYEESKKNNLTPLVQNDLHVQNPIAFSFFELTFFPDSVKKWPDLTDIPPNSAILVSKGNIKKESIKNLQLKDIYGSDYYILINKYQI